MDPDEPFLPKRGRLVMEGKIPEAAPEKVLIPDWRVEIGSSVWNAASGGLPWDLMDAVLLPEDQKLMAEKSHQEVFTAMEYYFLKFWSSFRHAIHRSKDAEAVAERNLRLVAERSKLRDDLNAAKAEVSGLKEKVAAAEKERDEKAAEALRHKNEVDKEYDEHKATQDLLLKARNEASDWQKKFEELERRKKEDDSTWEDSFTLEYARGHDEALKKLKSAGVLPDVSTWLLEPEEGQVEEQPDVQPDQQNPEPTPEPEKENQDGQ